MDLLLFYKSGMLLIAVCAYAALVNHDDLKFLYLTMISIIVGVVSAVAIFTV